MSDRIECLGEEVEKALSQLEQARAAAIREARDDQMMKIALLQHEALRLELRLGKDHPRVNRLHARLRGSLSLAQAFDVEQEVAAIKQPTVNEQDALVHGRVADENGRGISGLTVCLVDEEGQPAAGVEPAATDASGYFALIVPEEIAKKLAPPRAPGLSLGIFTQRNRQVHRTKTHLAIEPAARITENVVLDRSDLSASTKPVPRPPTDGNTVAVPSVVGLLESDAAQEIRSAGLTVGERQPRAVIDQIGLVLDQDPPAGNRVAPRTAVTLVVGAAREVEVPDVIGRRLDEAISLIRERHFILGTIQRRADERRDTVLEQKPAAGTRVAVATAIDLVVGGGPDSPELRSRVVELFVQDPRFEELGISGGALSNRFEERGLTGRAHFQNLLALSDRDIRDAMRLPNLRSAQIFKEILKRVLDELRG